MKRRFSPSHVFFGLILFLINCVIAIGETTQKIFLLFLYFIKLVFLQVKNVVTALFKKLFGFKIKLPKVQIPRLKLIFPKISIPHPNLPEIGLKIKFFLIGILVTLVVGVSYQGYLFVKNLPSPYYIGKVNYPLTSHIYDRNGQLLYEIYREQNRTPIGLDQIPDYVIKATIAAEDKDFYNHRGISFFGGIVRAIKDMIIYRKLQGGSTITQQLVKSSLLTPERTITRKVKEMILALWTERIYQKNQILEMYLNQVPYGGAAYGIEEAARIYFDKSAKDLDLSEAAMLAGLPQAPTANSPHNDPAVTQLRRNDVLGAMFELKMIDQSTYQAAVSQSIIVVPPKTSIKAPHFVFYLRQQLEENYGIKQVEEGGLRVTSTIDLRLQTELETILSEEIEKISNLNVSNGAILVTRPKTGEILAMVGSVNYFADPYGAYNVTTGQRQPGSAIKPLMYSLALEKGFTAATILDDTPVVFNVAGSQPYRPVNYDNQFHGRLPLRYALANSYNIPAVKTLASIGVGDFIVHARKLGITTWTEPSRYGLSLTLGGGEVKMVDMAVAFGVFANQGKATGLTGLVKIENTTGELVNIPSLNQVTVLDGGVAYIISDILSDNFSRQWAFGPNSALQIPGYKVAVKTGTTNDKKDNWTIGYNPEFLVVVWVGNNDNSPMNQHLTSGITGAAPIWNRVMSYLLKNYGDGQDWFTKPENIVEKKCYFGRTEYFLLGTENKAVCTDGIMNQTPTPEYRTTE